MNKSDTEEHKTCIYDRIISLVEQAIACDPNLTKRDLDMLAMGIECTYCGLIPDKDLLELSTIIDIKIREIMEDTNDSTRTSSACLTPEDIIPSLF